MNKYTNELIGHNHEGYTPIANSVWSRKNFLHLFSDDLQVTMRNIRTKEHASLIIKGYHEDLTKLERWHMFKAYNAVSSIMRQETNKMELIDFWYYSPPSLNENNK